MAALGEGGCCVLLLLAFWLLPLMLEDQYQCVWMFNILDTKSKSYYRPQRSWGKVIFSQASVILSTGGGIPACLAAGGCYPSMHCRWYSSMPCSRGVLSQHALQQGKPAPRGVPGLVGAWSGGVCYRRVCSKGGVPGGEPPKRPLLRAVCILLECILVIHVIYSVLSFVMYLH